MSEWRRTDGAKPAQTIRCEWWDDDKKRLRVTRESHPVPVLLWDECEEEYVYSTAVYVRGAGWYDQQTLFTVKPTHWLMLPRLPQPLGQKRSRAMRYEVGELGELVPSAPNPNLPTSQDERER